MSTLNHDTELEEIWRPIANYEGLYEVSSLGRVRSLDHQSRGRWNTMKTSPGRMMKQSLLKEGYIRVDLSKGGIKTHKLVHRLVAGAFIDNPDDKAAVNHIDSNRTNNVVTNLEWCTHKENTQHALKAGKMGPFLVCKRRGHELTPENTIVTNGVRQCKPCVAYNRVRRAQLRKAAAERWGQE